MPAAKKYPNFFVRGEISKVVQILKLEYPQLKYIFIDNAILEAYSPGEWGPTEWENHLYSDFPFENLKKLGTPIRIKKANTRIAVILNKNYKHHKIFYHSIEPYIKKGMALGIIEKIFQNRGCSVYRIK